MTDYAQLRRMADGVDPEAVASAQALALVDIAESLDLILKEMQQ